MEDAEVASRVEFHGVAYVVTVSVCGQQLHVQVEVDDHAPQAAGSSAASPRSTTTSQSAATNGNAEMTCWTGSFPSAYIEELTRKTGNFKRFSIFVSMLLSALSHRSDAVFIDLLTTSDLELYRKRKMSSKGLFPPKPQDAFEKKSLKGVFVVCSSFPSAAAGGAASNKRYLILTYAVEFDRVHYPLPLTLVQTPSPEILQRTIRRLRQELAASSRDSKVMQLHDEVEALKEENRRLKNTLKQHFEPSPASENVDFLNQPTHHGGAESPIDLQRELKLRLAQAQGHILPRATGNDVEHLRYLEKQMEQERVDAKRKMNDSNRLVEETLSQLQLIKMQMEETQLKNRELMRQLAIARVKAGTVHQPSKQPNAARLSARENAPLGVSSGSAATGRAALRKRSTLPTRFRQQHPYGESDNEYEHTTNGDGDRVVSQRQQPQRPFRRFDPTAYQLEKQRKLRMRSQSPNANGRPRRNSNTGGYTSDSSTGGYSSADSNGSNRSSRRGRTRARASVEHQREVAARLSSPKRVPNSDPPVPAPRFQTPPLHHRPGTRAVNRGRSPSPHTANRRNLTGQQQVPSSAASHVPPRHNRFGQQQQQQRGSTSGLPPPTTTKRSGPVKRRPSPARKAAEPSKRNALLADTSIDSFSDIDDRLNALQQFLKEAKQGSGATTTTNQK
ncbi:hypothetical protein FI667_g7113, partial [Globisporangium splendens]